jgi:hypothetical protein
MKLLSRMAVGTFTLLSVGCGEEEETKMVPSGSKWFLASNAEHGALSPETQRARSASGFQH